MPRIGFKTFLTILTLLLPMLCPLDSTAGRNETPDTITARRAFVEMPSGVLDMLSRNTRLDMLDYYDTDSIYKTSNNLRGQAWLEEVTPDFLSVRLSGASTMQFKVLPLKDGRQILMTVYTVGDEGAAKDSEIEFYDARLNPLPTTKFFPEPRLADFFDTKGYQTRMKEVETILPFFNFFFEAGPDTTDITGKLSYGDILTLEDAGIIELLALPQVTFHWDGRKFRK